MLYNLESKSKKENIIDLIRSSSLRLSNLYESLLPLYIQAITTVEGDTSGLSEDKIMKTVENKVTSEEFLKDFTKIFEDVFSHSEIKILLNYHHSQVLSKFLDTYTLTMRPIFLKCTGIVREAVEKEVEAKERIKNMRLVK